MLEASPQYAAAMAPLPAFLNGRLALLTVDRREAKDSLDAEESDTSTKRDAEKDSKKKISPMDGALAGAKSFPTDVFDNVTLQILDEMLPSLIFPRNFPLYWFGERFLAPVAADAAILVVKHDFKLTPTFDNPDPASVPVISLDGMLKNWGAEAAEQLSSYHHYSKCLGRQVEAFEHLDQLTPQTPPHFASPNLTTKLKSLANINTHFAEPFAWKWASARNISISYRQFDLTDYKTATAGYCLHKGCRPNSRQQYARLQVQI